MKHKKEPNILINAHMQLMFLDVLSVQEFEALQVCPNQREEKKNNAAISVRIKSCYSSILFSHLNISEGGGGRLQQPG